ncbi:hypothetical protein ACFX13_003758 [Malus domestica]|uniref:Retrotransposon Copia-like N-terminal domain-containing protein n=1 Tax=Malus domestica TaxID=3750 RepID=A0A498IWR2_MALDO|nr:hypothetical protein DVH24_034749 [Malus domestica]
MGYVDGTKPCPAYFLTDGQGNITSTVDPAFDVWIHADRSIQNWINGLLTPSVFPIMAHSAASRTTWVSLEKRYASQTQNNQVLQLLRAAGIPIADHDLVTIVMNAFPTYEFSTTAITFDYLQKVLLNLEKHLVDQQGVPNYSLQHVTAPLYASPPHGPGHSRRGTSLAPGDFLGVGFTGYPGSSSVTGKGASNGISNTGVYSNSNGNDKSFGKTSGGNGVSLPSKNTSRPSSSSCCAFGSPKVLE